MINSSNEYAMYAFEMGFNHAKAGIPPSATCDPAYRLGYQAANA